MKKLLWRLSNWCSGWLQPPAHDDPAESPHPHAPLLIIVEGPHDVEFLKRISAVLNRWHADLPDLGRAESDGRLTFLPAVTAPSELPPGERAMLKDQKLAG